MLLINKVNYNYISFFYSVLNLIRAQGYFKATTFRLAFRKSLEQSFCLSEHSTPSESFVSFLIVRHTLIRPD